MADVTDQVFDSEVMQSKIPTMVDFWAPWCAPCRILGPVVEELAKDYEGRLKVLKMNVDENTRVPSQFGIMSIPTVMIFKDGKPAKTIIGAQPKENIKKEIEEVLGT